MTIVQCDSVPTDPVMRCIGEEQDSDSSGFSGVWSVLAGL
jgi:hypothetical protein